MTTVVWAMAAGLVLGARHAFEPDHLAAVSVLATEARGPRWGALVGALWGVGHSVALFLAGTLLVVVSGAVPEEARAALELVVAVMLIALGARAILRGARPHEHRAAASGEMRRPAPWRPVAVGMVHGLAGSGAVVALAMAQLSGSAGRVGFMAFFGLGSIFGMAGASSLAGWPMARLQQWRRGARLTATLAGGLSVCIGVWWGYPLVVSFLG